MARLTIYDRRERALVAAADALLSPVALRRAFRRPADRRRRARFSAFRLERIGDLLMTVPARSPSCARAGARRDDRPRRRQLEPRRSRRRSRASIASRRWTPRWLARWMRTGSSPLGLARQAARVAIAALRSRDQLRARHPDEPRAGGRRARGARRASRAAAAARCSTSRSTTTRRRTPPTTRGGWCTTAVRPASPRRAGDVGAPRARRPPRGGDAAPRARSRGATRRSACTSAAGARSSSGPRRGFATSAATSRARSIGGDRADRHAGGPGADRHRPRGAAAGSRARPLRRHVDLLTVAARDRTARSVRHRRHGADAPGRTPSARRSSRCSGRRIRAATRRAACETRVVRDRSAVQPVQPHPAAAGALRRTHAGLPRRASSVAHGRSAAIDERSRSGQAARRTRRADDHARRRLRRRAAARRPASPISTPHAPNARTTRRYAWIKALRHLRVDGVPFRSRFTLRGDSLWWFAELCLPQGAGDPARAADDRGASTRWSSATGRWRCATCRRIASGPDRRGGRRARRSATAVRAGRVGGVALAADGRARERLAAGARLSRLRAAAPPRRARARRGVRAHRASGAAGRRPTAAPSRTSARCCARSNRASPRTTIRYVGIGARTNFRRAPLVGSAASRAPATAVVADRALRAGRARCGGLARGVSRSARRAPEPVEQRRSARARRHPRRATAGRSCASSSPASRCCSFPGRRARWTKRPPRSTRIEPERRRHLRRGRRLGTRARARMPAARHPARRACSTASSTATG